MACDVKSGEAGCGMPPNHTEESTAAGWGKDSGRYVGVGCEGKIKILEGKMAESPEYPQHGNGEGSLKDRAP